MPTQYDKAVHFGSLHTPGKPLILANAWDVATARISQAAGVAAVATTSAGLAWSLGAADGDALDRTIAIEAIGRIVSAVGVPVTADIESGYAANSAGVGDEEPCAPPRWPPSCRRRRAGLDRQRPLPGTRFEPLSLRISATYVSGWGPTPVAAYLLARGV